MKTTCVFLVALLAAAATATAQPSFGVKAGLNFADLSVTEAGGVEPSNRTGAVAGVFVTIPGSGIFSFQPEALFSMQGAKFTDSGETGTVKIDYFQIPLLARFKPGASPVGILVGPALGWRMRSKIAVEGAPDEDFKDEVKGTDVGIVAGVAVDVGHLVLDGRYTWGLSNISKDSNGTTIRNRVASITAGLRF